MRYFPSHRSLAKLASGHRQSRSHLFKLGARCLSSSNWHTHDTLRQRRSTAGSTAFCSPTLNECFSSSYARLPDALSRYGDVGCGACACSASHHRCASSVTWSKRTWKKGLGARDQSHRPFSQSSTYVSKHFKLNEGDVERFLLRHGLQHRCVKDHAVVQLCPFCPPINNKFDNMYKLYILRSSGVFLCHRCKSKGSWFDLKQQLSFADEQITSMGKRSRSSQQPVGLKVETESLGTVEPQPSPDQQRKYETLLHGHRDSTSDETPVKRYLNNERGLKDDVLKVYGVGATSCRFFGGNGWSTEWSMTFPMFDDKERIARYKVRSIQSKANMKLEPKGGSWGLFGLQTVAKDVEEVVLTEGELDAMSVYQATGRAAISVPNGASSLPIQVLPLLERFKRIYLWMDEDDAGQNGAKQFARKLGLGRCVMVRGANGTDRSTKDANDCLRHGVDMESMIESAKPIQHEGVMRFEDLREEVFAELNGNGSNEGAVKCISLPRLNNLLKGHRYGEVTILSGHTGVGKTTLLAQMSLDYCLQGVGTLWGSFEVGNVRLAQRLLQQFHAIHRDGSSLLSRFDYWADRFSELPMYFMKYHGSNPVHRIVDVMEYANYAMDCRHMVLDNLQFMTYVSATSRGEEGGRFEVMDEAVAQIRQFATGCGSHVTLVVHPRKTDDDSRISIASVYGSAKATQEADNVLVLQRTANGKELEVMKNRFDGAVGSIALRFDKKRLLYAEADSGGDWALPELKYETKSAGVERVHKKRRTRRKVVEGGSAGALDADSDDICGLFD